MKRILTSILSKSDNKKHSSWQLWKMNNENKQLKKEYQQKKVTNPLIKLHKKKSTNTSVMQMKLKNELNKLNHKLKLNARNASDWNWKMKNLLMLSLK